MPPAGSSRCGRRRWAGAAASSRWRAAAGGRSRARRRARSTRARRRRVRRRGRGVAPVRGLARRRARRAERPGARRFGAPQRISGLTTRVQNPLTVAVDEEGAAVVAFAEAGDLTMARTVDGAFATPVRVHDRTETTAGRVLRGGGHPRADRGRRLHPPRGPRAAGVPAHRRHPDRRHRPGRGDRGDERQRASTSPPRSARTARRSSSARRSGRPTRCGSTDATPSGPRSRPFPRPRRPRRIGLNGGCVTWTEGPKGFAAFGGQTLALGTRLRPRLRGAGHRRRAGRVGPRPRTHAAGRHLHTLSSDSGPISATEPAARQAHRQVEVGHEVPQDLAHAGLARRSPARRRTAGRSAPRGRPARAP